MEQATDVEKATAVYEFLDFKRRNKVIVTMRTIRIRDILPLKKYECAGCGDQRNTNLLQEMLVFSLS
ncbi:hypothetical protein RchiOBHm_Chr5g0055881 [Rosa chinensis]|uniref:Uncharacterized protein n=1 Tax=Rosa chinensis TaxID=74649 RepID=A0A2P6QGH9_ROSCH|nr:hypothetical protein RchiOBHm_Chr5g0055881 [Rosa chinensis]